MSSCAVAAEDIVVGHDIPSVHDVIIVYDFRHGEGRQPLCRRLKERSSD